MKEAEGKTIVGSWGTGNNKDPDRVRIFLDDGTVWELLAFGGKHEAPGIVNEVRPMGDEDRELLRRYQEALR